MALANGAKLEDILAGGGVTSTDDAKGGGLQGAREIMKLENVVADREQRLERMMEKHRAAMSETQEEHASLVIETEIRLQMAGFNATLSDSMESRAEAVALKAKQKADIAKMEEDLLELQEGPKRDQLQAKLTQEKMALKEGPADRQAMEAAIVAERRLREGLKGFKAEETNAAGVPEGAMREWATKKVQKKAEEVAVLQKEATLRREEAAGVGIKGIKVVRHKEVNVELGATASYEDAEEAMPRQEDSPAEEDGLGGCSICRGLRRSNIRLREKLEAAQQANHKVRAAWSAATQAQAQVSILQKERRMQLEFHSKMTSLLRMKDEDEREAALGQHLLGAENALKLITAQVKMATLFQLSWKAQETAVEQLAFAAEAATAEAAFIADTIYEVEKKNVGADSAGSNESSGEDAVLKPKAFNFEAALAYQGLRDQRAEKLRVELDELLVEAIAAERDVINSDEVFADAVMVYKNAPSGAEKEAAMTKMLEADAVVRACKKIARRKRRNATVFEEKVMAIEAVMQAGVESGEFDEAMFDIKVGGSDDEDSDNDAPIIDDALVNIIAADAGLGATLEALPEAEAIVLRHSISAKLASRDASLAVEEARKAYEELPEGSAKELAKKRLDEAEARAKVLTEAANAQMSAFAAQFPGSCVLKPQDTAVVKTTVYNPESVIGVQLRAESQASSSSDNRDGLRPPRNSMFVEQQEQTAEISPALPPIPPPTPTTSELDVVVNSIGHGAYNEAIQEPEVQQELAWRDGVPEIRQLDENGVQETRVSDPRYEPARCFADGCKNAPHLDFFFCTKCHKQGVSKGGIKCKDTNYLEHDKEDLLGAGWGDVQALVSSHQRQQAILCKQAMAPYEGEPLALLNSPPTAVPRGSTGVFKARPEKTASTKARMTDHLHLRKEMLPESAPVPQKVVDRQAQISSPNSPTREAQHRTNLQTKDSKEKPLPQERTTISPRRLASHRAEPFGSMWIPPEGEHELDVAALLQTRDLQSPPPATHSIPPPL